MSAPSGSIVPELARVRRGRRPASAERRLRNGLRVVAVRRGEVPMAELRLRIPFGGTAPSHAARVGVLSDTVLAGTSQLSRVAFAEELQGVGATLHASVSADRLAFSASTLTAELPRVLQLLAQALVGATYPADEVARERTRLADHLRIARSRPGVLAQETLERRLWGNHPYARDLPQPDAVARVTAAQLRTLHAERVSPRGATLVVVGALAPQRALDQVEAALSSWRGRAARAGLPELPTTTPGPVLLVDRPGSVQSALRIAGAVPSRRHPDSAALGVANLIFGGNFSSRWVSNIREDKGYTYSPRSSIDHHVLGSVFVAAADVATEVTAPALLETQYELGRIAALPVTDGELSAARQYAIGTLALGTATQAGLAATLSQLLALGLDLDWLLEQPSRLAAVTVADVARVGAQYLAPARLTTVIVGDAAQVSGPLGRLVAVEPV